jgi:aconitase A
MNQLAKEDNIFSAKSKKLKKDIANKPYWDNTHPIQSAIQQQEEEDDEDEKTRPKGYDLLKKVYGGGKHTELLNPSLKKKLAKHLEEHQSEGVGDPQDVSQSKYLRKEIKRINDLHLTPANQISRHDPIYQFSNPRAVQKKAFQLYGKNAVVYRSEKKDKKYQILNENTGGFTHFGQMGYEDFSKHLDPHRRDNYLKRSLNIKGDWKKDIYSPNFLAITLLW